MYCNLGRGVVAVALQVLRDAAVILAALSTAHDLFTHADFMWLSIKPTLLLSHTTATLATPVVMSAVCAVATLVFPWQQSLTNNAAAVILQAFYSAGLHWIQYVIGPVVMLCLMFISKSFARDVIVTLHHMADDNFAPALFRKSAATSHFPTLIGVGLVGVVSVFASLLVDFAALLELSALCVLLQQLVTCCLATLLRYRPSHHMHALTQAQHEDSNLIGQAVTSDETALDSCGVDGIGDNLYGALHTNSGSPAVATTAAAGDNSNNHGCDNGDASHNDNIDDIVEEYRLTSAMQCYRSALQATTNVRTTRAPSRHTHRAAVVSTTLIGCLSLNTGSIVSHGWLRHHSDISAPVIGWFVTSGVALCVCVLVLRQQPRDKIIPRTMLLQAPRPCVVATVTILLLATLATTLSALSWSVTVIWLAIGGCAQYAHVHVYIV